MSKLEPLSQDALARARVQPEVLRYLERARRSGGLEREAMRVLDWGCGRGESVLLLREQGYAAYGVDVAAEYLANARAAFQRFHLDPDELLHRIDPAGKLPFPDASFDFAFSEQVLEHVSDLDALAGELARVLRPGATALHLLPPHRGIVEEHLRMPLVHWLPKGRLRRAAILGWAAVGLGPPHWLRELPLRERAARWAAYSEEQTFYRSPSRLRRAFEARGLRVRLVAQEHPRLRAVPVLGRLLARRSASRLAGWLLAHFVRVAIALERVSETSEAAGASDRS